MQTRARSRVSSAAWRVRSSSSCCSRWLASPSSAKSARCARPTTCQSGPTRYTPHRNPPPVLPSHPPTHPHQHTESHTLFLSVVDQKLCRQLALRNSPRFGHFSWALHSSMLWMALHRYCWFCYIIFHNWALVWCSNRKLSAFSLANKCIILLVCLQVFSFNLNYPK